MKCDKCHENDATVFITQKINGEVRELNLCETCAEQQNKAFFDEGPSFQQFLTGFIDGKSGETDGRIKTCPGCGMTLMDFKKHSKVGCAQCYTVFYDHLQPVIKKLHGSARHTGKVPKRIGGEQQLIEKIRHLEAQLKVALMQEDYESAAKLRDAIRDIRKEASM